MMRNAALVLIDLQNDFLALPRIEPHPSSVVAGAAALLTEFRKRGLPVIHVRTIAESSGLGRMPHWQQLGTVRCVAGTDGYLAPAILTPTEEEIVFDKTWFSAFSVPAFETYLRDQGIEVLVLAGVFIQTCLRQTALDGYQKGLSIYIAVDASGSHDPLHGALTLNYLDDRAMIPLEMTALLHTLEMAGAQSEPEPPVVLASLVASVRRAQQLWAKEPLEHRVSKLNQLADRLTMQTEIFAQMITAQVRKPITLARSEVDRAVALLRAVAVRSAKSPQIKVASEGRIRFRPRGIVAMITPWNNPLAIPIGKIAPALAYGNAILWKPSPQATKIARALLPLIVQSGFPDTLVSIVEGDERQGRQLIASNIDAVAFSGSSRTGWSIIAQASSRLLPVQAELGGNNGVIVSVSADLQAAADAIAEGAFGFAGQRCTANRRVIVLTEVYDEFLALIENSTQKLQCGDPLDVDTRVGPMISARAAQTVAALIERVRSAGYIVWQSDQSRERTHLNSAAFYPPTLVRCDEPKAFIVQEESFGPILVAQKASNFKHAMELLDDVPYGLVAALFSKDESEQAQFLENAQAGILKMNASTVNAGVDLPFTGWKGSGFGAAEHGEANAEFFTKRQSIYS